MKRPEESRSTVETSFAVMDGIALDDEADAGGELDLLRHRRLCAERDKGIVAIVVVFRQVGTARPRRLAAGRNVAVLRQPKRFEAARLRLHRQVRGLYRIVRRKDRQPDMHVRSWQPARHHSRFRVDAGDRFEKMPSDSWRVITAVIDGNTAIDPF
jgi:hypothetical protein